MVPKGSDCTSSIYKLCLVASGKCVECKADADCPAGETCTKNSYGTKTCK